MGPAEKRAANAFATGGSEEKGGKEQDRNRATEREAATETGKWCRDPQNHQSTDKSIKDRFKTQ